MKKIALATLAVLVFSGAAANAQYAFEVNSLPLSGLQKTTDSVETGSIHAAKIKTRIVKRDGARYEQSYSLNGAGEIVVITESRL